MNRVVRSVIGVAMSIAIAGCGAGSGLEAEISEPTAERSTLHEERLTKGQEDDLRSQIMDCWNVSEGAAERRGMVVEFRVSLNIDGTIKRVTAKDPAKIANDRFLRAVADSARAALFDPRCSPRNFPHDKYDQWKEVVIVFNASRMVDGENDAK